MLHFREYKSLNGNHDSVRWRRRGQRRCARVLQSRPFPETRVSLLETMRDGSGQAGWREFYERYAPAVYRVCRLRGLGAHDGEDVVQQVMVAIAGQVDRFEYDRSRGRFRHWVRRVTENKISDLIRRRPREIGDELALAACADEHAETNQAWEHEWQLQDILYCMHHVAGDIAPRRLEAFRLYVLEGVSASDTAEQLGMTTGHVYVIRNIVLNLIRDHLRELGSAELPPIPANRG